MANLVLKRFQCVEDTDAVGGESPYFITWVGDMVMAKSTLRATRKTYWNNNADKGPGAWPAPVTRTTSTRCANPSSRRSSMRCRAVPAPTTT